MTVGVPVRTGLRSSLQDWVTLESEEMLGAIVSVAIKINKKNITFTAVQTHANAKHFFYLLSTDEISEEPHFPQYQLHVG